MRIPGDVLRIISFYVVSPLDLVRLSRCNQYFYRHLKESKEIEKWKSYSLEKRMRKAAKCGEEETVRLCISKGADNWNWAFYGASRGGHRVLVDFFISKGADNWNRALQGAARGGHRALVDLFITKGADNWNWALYYASRGGHCVLVELFEKKIRQRDEQ